MLAIGAGPSNLALAIAVEELAPTEFAKSTLVIEQHDNIVWQRGMMLPWAQSQVSFLKDLVTMRNPCSSFSFVNYLHETGRLHDFINMSSFLPFRLEISSYLEWVARSLTTVQVQYGRRCESIEAVRSRQGLITSWLVGLTDGSTISARNLVVGAGRDPHIPEVFTTLPREKVIHSTEYSHRVAQLDTGRPVGSWSWVPHRALPRCSGRLISGCRQRPARWSCGRSGWTTTRPASSPTSCTSLRLPTRSMPPSPRRGTGCCKRCAGRTMPGCRRNCSTRSTGRCIWNG